MYILKVYMSEMCLEIKDSTIENFQNLIAIQV